MRALRIRSIVLPLVLLWVLAGFLVFVPSGQAEEKIIIRVASPFKTGHILCETSEKFKELLEQANEGRIEVQVQSGVGSEEEINEWCRQGMVEMQATGGRPLEVAAPQYFFLNAPYVMKDFDHFMRVWKGPLGEQARDLVERHGKYLDKINLIF